MTGSSFSKNGGGRLGGEAVGTSLHRQYSMSRGGPSIGFLNFFRFFRFFFFPSLLIGVFHFLGFSDLRAVLIMRRAAASAVMLSEDWGRVRSCRKGRAALIFGGCVARCQSLFSTWGRVGHIARCRPLRRAVCRACLGCLLSGVILPPVVAFCGHPFGAVSVAVSGGLLPAVCGHPSAFRSGTRSALFPCTRRRRFASTPPAMG